MSQYRYHIFTPAFRTIFLFIPLLFGITMTVFLSSSVQFVPQLFSNNNSSVFLRAEVFPAPDEIPDGNLPQGKVESDFLPAIINIILALVSTILLGALLVSGTLFIIHFGDEEQLKTAKGILKWSISGIIIVLVAYAIVRGVLNIDFIR